MLFRSVSLEGQSSAAPVLDASCSTHPQTDAVPLPHNIAPKPHPLHTVTMGLPVRTHELALFCWCERAGAESNVTNGEASAWREGREGDKKGLSPPPLPPYTLLWQVLCFVTCGLERFPISSHRRHRKRSNPHADRRTHTHADTHQHVHTLAYTPLMQTHTLTQILPLAHTYMIIYFTHSPALVVNTPQSEQRPG